MLSRHSCAQLTSLGFGDLNKVNFTSSRCPTHWFIFWMWSTAARFTTVTWLHFIAKLYIQISLNGSFEDYVYWSRIEFHKATAAVIHTGTCMQYIQHPSVFIMLLQVLSYTYRYLYALHLASMGVHHVISNSYMYVFTVVNTLWNTFSDVFIITPLACLVGVFVTKVFVLTASQCTTVHTCRKPYDSLAIRYATRLKIKSMQPALNNELLQTESRHLPLNHVHSLI